MKFCENKVLFGGFLKLLFVKLFDLFNYLNKRIKYKRRGSGIKWVNYN